MKGFSQLLIAGLIGDYQGLLCCPNYPILGISQCRVMFL